MSDELERISRDILTVHKRLEESERKIILALPRLGRPRPELLRGVEAGGAGVRLSSVR